MIRPHLATLVDRLLELSEGVWQLDEDGKTVYQRAPDRKSIEYLIDRALGRPTTAKVNDGPVAFAGTVTVILPDNSRR